MTKHRARSISTKNFHKSVSFCQACGKACYSSKAIARRAARHWFPTEHMSVYRCGQYWHLGHLGPGILAGEVDRHALYGPRS